jgi:hypothetical protein
MLGSAWLRRSKPAPAVHGQRRWLEYPGRLADDGIAISHVLEHVYAVDDIRAGVTSGPGRLGRQPGLAAALRCAPRTVN